MLGKTFRGAAVLLVLGMGSSLAAGLPGTTDNVVVLAQDSVTLRGDAQLNSGQIVVNNPGGVLTVGRGVRALDDTEIVADIVTVTAPPKRKAELFDVLANSFVDQDNAQVGGTWSTIGVFDQPLFSFPSAPQVTPGTDPCPNATGTKGNCFVGRKKSPVWLEPGNYGNIRVRGQGVLYLTGGEYNLKSLSTGIHSHVIVESSATINVQKNVSFGWFSTFLPGQDLNPRCVVLNVAGGRVRILVAAVSAVINAPDATVIVGIRRNIGGTTYIGNLAAKTVRVKAWSTLQAADPLLSACPEP
jgi:hypothetical protein